MPRAIVAVTEADDGGETECEGKLDAVPDIDDEALGESLALGDAASDGFAIGVTENVVAGDGVDLSEAERAAVSVEDADPHSDTVANVDSEPAAVGDGARVTETDAAALPDSNTL